MLEVDVVNETRVGYTTKLWTKKWRHRLLIYILNSSIHNAYILYKVHIEAASLIKPMDRNYYNYHIARWLDDH